MEPSDEYIVDFDYNGQTWASSTGMWDYSDSMQIGVESDNSTPSFNSFSNTVIIANPQVLESGNSSWTPWPGNSSSLIYYNDSPSSTVTCGWATDTNEKNYAENESPCIYS